MAGLALAAAAALTGPGTAQAGTVPNKIASGAGTGRAAAGRAGPNRITAGPPSPGKDNELYGVAALSAGDAWTVGSYQTGPSGSLNLIEHWNGRTWKLVHSPDPGGPAGDNTLYSVTAVSARNIWAVGYYGQTSGNQTLVEHWNGSVWTVVPSPESGILSGVAASSRRNAWAVGYYWPTQPTVPNTLVEHWNGAAWKEVPSPDRPGPGDPNLLTGAAVTSARNAWAVGYYANTPSGEGAEQTLIEHWNGHAWRAVQSPDPAGSSGFNDLNSVATASARDAWAAGGAISTVALHWNGHAWKG
jgi:hypothetical protein